MPSGWPDSRTASRTWFIRFDLTSIATTDHPARSAATIHGTTTQRVLPEPAGPMTVTWRSTTHPGSAIESRGPFAG